MEVKSRGLFNKKKKKKKKSHDIQMINLIMQATSIKVNLGTILVPEGQCF